jgi:hypothetical protein
MEKFHLGFRSIVLAPSFFNLLAGEDIGEFQEHSAPIITSGNSKFQHIDVREGII